MNLVNQLFVNSGRPEQGDNRSYFVKALNKVLSDGFIKVSIQDKGRVWTNPKYVDSNGQLKKFDIEIKGYGYTARVYRGSFSATDLLKVIGEFIQSPEISEKHIKSITASGLEICECSRCYGKGVIPAFSYYCNGICFECYGSKYSVRKFSLSV
jgi:hypothetical protein